MAFHATGHNAEIKHFVVNSETQQKYFFIGYMSEAPTIMCFYLGRKPYIRGCRAFEASAHLNIPVVHSYNNPPKAGTLEDFVKNSKELIEDIYPYIYIKRKIYERYIK